MTQPETQESGGAVAASVAEEAAPEIDSLYTYTVTRPGTDPSEKVDRINLASREEPRYIDLQNGTATVHRNDADALRSAGYELERKEVK